MKVIDFVNLCDFPDTVDFTLYDYDVYDVVFEGKCDEIPELFFERKVRGFELHNNKLILNLRAIK